VIRRVINFFRRMYNLLEVTKALSRGAATKNDVNIKKNNPSTWEFSGFSQNGEDGLLDFLINQLKVSDKSFLEIGSSTGVENNTTWLAIAKRFSGVMIEGSEDQAKRSRQFINQFSIGVDVVNKWVNVGNANEVIALTSSTTDVFSIDIDGNDYYIVKSLFDLGFRPKIVVVEYNSAFGPDQNKTIIYDKHMIVRNGKDMDYSEESRLYYGVSIGGWKTYFDKVGYKFITVDSNGVNAIFLEPSYFDPDFLKEIKGNHFQENFFQKRLFKSTWKSQFKKIEHLGFTDI